MLVYMTASGHLILSKKCEYIAEQALWLAEHLYREIGMLVSGLHTDVSSCKGKIAGLLKGQQQ